MSVFRIGLFCALWSTFIACTHAYIPASPTNDTATAVQDGLNVTDISKLNLQWYHGGDSQTVSYQLVGADSLGVSKVRAHPGLGLGAVYAARRARLSTSPRLI